MNKITRAGSKAEYIALQLLETIIASGTEPGHSFATEAELLDKYDVSRPTLRESLRILQSQGVLDLRPGPGGGIIARQPSIDILAHGLSIFLRLNHIPFVTVLHARELIEPALAREAAQNGSEDDFAALGESIARMQALDDQDAFVEENRTFHGIIARASGNKVLEVFWSAISIVASGEHHGITYSLGNWQHVIAAHQRILDACRARDPAAAESEMTAHVAALEKLMRSRYRHMLEQTTSVTVKNRRRAG